MTSRQPSKSILDDDYLPPDVLKMAAEKLADVPQHILVSGHSGAGKSTLAKALAEKLNLPYAQVDHRPEFNEFLAANTPDNHLPTDAPKNKEFRELLQSTALQTIADAKTPTVIEGVQLAYLPPETLAQYKRVHVNPSLKQTYNQRLERTKRRYLKDPTKEWTSEVEQEKRRVADLVYGFHTPTLREYDKLPGTLKYKPGQNLDKLIARLQKQADLLPDVQATQRYIAEKQSSAKMRALFRLVKEVGESPAGKTMWRAFVGNKPVGFMQTQMDAVAGIPRILRSELSGAFQGMGLGKKMYMEVAKRTGGNLLSDVSVSDAARRVWASLQRRGRGVTLSPNAINKPHGPDLRFNADYFNQHSLADKGQGPWPYIFKLSLPSKIMGAIPRIKTSEKQADLQPDVQLQEHQQRIADKLTGEDPRLLVYHGLGSGKSLSAIAAAEAAKQKYQEDYGVVVPASLRANFQKEIDKFTTGSKPEIMSYTGLGLGKQFKKPPDTLIMDEAARLRNPDAASTRAATEAARQAKRLLLLTGTPITNSPTDLASLLSMLNNQKITPEQFEAKYVGYKKVGPGWWGWFRGAKPGEKAYVKNEDELRELLKGKVDYHPSKTPEGVNVNEEIVRVPMSDAQQKIQNAIRTRIPPGFLWKLDQEFPLSREELAKMNSFLNGLRQVSLSTQAFRKDKNPLKAFEQSSKMQRAYQDLQETIKSDPRKKAIIYSNFIDSGVNPYAAALERDKIPYGVFHGGIPLKDRQKALKDYNEGRSKALLLGPAAAEGISTKGTSLIQLLDPHWNEARSQQARGRGLRFDSHTGLPEDLRNVIVRRYLTESTEPGMIGKYLFGAKRQRTGDEVLERLTAEKEEINEAFRRILREEGSASPPEDASVKISSILVDEPEEMRQNPAAKAWLQAQFGL